MSEPRSTRRGALARALALVGGVAGVTVAGKAEAATGARTIVLHGRNLRSDARPGAHARTGERLTIDCELLDHRGSDAGRLYGAAFALRGPGSSEAERLELHTFELRDGTVVGSGTGRSEEGTFAILGGTGRYAGARGTYTVRPESDGTAEILLTLL